MKQARAPLTVARLLFFDIETTGLRPDRPYCVEEAHRTAAYENGDGGRHVRVLGYAPVDRGALQKLAQAFAGPAVYELCDWDRCAAKPMPDTFSQGTRLGFELRACPVVRKASAGEGKNQAGERRTWKKGQELDAFLAEAWTRPEEKDLNREAVYRAWLERQFVQRGGAEPLSTGVERFAIERVVRRTQSDGRTARSIKIPDVTFTGTLTVTDSDAFIALLKSGLGRHKSFGFGMLKVRRA